MHYAELHTHRWAWVFHAAYDRIEKALKTEDAEEKYTLMHQVVHGDLEREIPEEIMPGVLMWIPYYRGVQGEMQIRYDCIKDAFSGDINEDLIDNQAFDIHKMFLEDVKTITEERGFLPFDKVLALSSDGSIKNFRMPEDWVETYQDLRQKTLDALEARALSTELVQEWMLYSLRSLITYNYWLARQAFLSFQIIDAVGEDGFIDLIKESADDFGWIVSREFFYHTMQRAGLEGAELYNMGRYAMYCDQIMVSMDREKDNGVLKARKSILKNCELYQGIRTPAEYAGRSLTMIGAIVCDYCENHGKKNSAIFTPPDQHANYRRIESFGYGDQQCVFYNDFTEGDDEEMDRFMEAQDIVFGEEEYESWD